MISIVINTDTRPGVESEVTRFTGMNDGCRNFDFLIEGVVNKQKFFAGFETETILHVDVHQEIPPSIRTELDRLVDCLVIRKHSRHFMGADPFTMFNDINYLNALSLARGEYVAHFDSDCAAFARDKGVVDGLIGLLDGYKYVSYPSDCSPTPVVDTSFDHWWVSTRFFLCRKESLDITELEKCIRNSDYMWDKYGHKKRKCPWLEHCLGIISDSSVIYPPRDLSNLAIFCWDRYTKGVLGKLNTMDFEWVSAYISSCGGVHYPCDVSAKPL